MNFKFKLGNVTIGQLEMPTSDGKGIIKDFAINDIEVECDVKDFASVVKTIKEAVVNTDTKPEAVKSTTTKVVKSSKLSDTKPSTYVPADDEDDDDDDLY